MFLRPVGFETTIRGAFVWEYQQTNARLAGVDVQTHWKMSEQWQHDFLAYVNGRDKESLIDIPLNLSNKIQFSKGNGMMKTRVKSEIVLRQNQFPDNNFTTNIVVNNELTPF
jgi:iron complex outermembrane receptor protein